MKRHILSIFGCLLMALSLPLFAGQWTTYPTVASVTRAAIMHDKAFVLCGNTLCVSDTGYIENINTLSRLNGLTGTEVFDIRYSVSADRLAIVYTDGNIDILTSDDKIIPIPDFANSSSASSHYPTSIAVQQDSLYVQSSSNTITIDLKKALICNVSDGQLDLIAIDESSSYSTQLAKELNNNLDPNHNYVKVAACMAIQNGRLITVQSSHSYYGVLGGSGHISILDLEDNTWSQISQTEVHDKARAIASDRYWFSNIIAVGTDETDPSHFYVSRDGFGLYEFNNDTLSNLLMPRNCDGLQAIIEENCRVSAVHQDADGNLWVVCAGIDEKQLRCRTAAGKWAVIPISGFTNTTAGCIDMMMSQHALYDYIWLVRNYRWDEFGGAIYDRNNNTSAYFTSLIDQDGNTLHPQYLYSVIEDNEGAVWLLTSIGPCIADNQKTFLNYAKSTNQGSIRRVKIPRNDGSNLADYLLDNVETVCGVVDAANTKWIGTASNGVYHLSADGLTQLDHFTTDNSPLYDNAIQSMKYEGETGRLYIATSGGICVYQTDAVNGSTDNSKIYCYPNPVRPAYSGKLYICELKDQSDIRITDCTGHVVYNATTYGGQTSWDLRNNSGDRVKPGIYYIYSIDSDGKDGGMTKLLVQ